jgi:CMP-N,N'-diacetyllegionaminic acid synthase
LKKSNYDADIVINTDSESLMEIFNNNPLRSVDIIERSADLAGDKVAKVDVIQNCLEVMEEKNGSYDLIIDLDITSPLRTVKDLDDMIEKKLNTDYDLIFSVTDSRRNPYFNMVMETEHGYDRVIKSNFNTRQEAPVIYDMNASIYVYSREFLQRKVGLFDGKCGIHKMFDTGVLDLDHENDMFLMEVIAKYLFENNEEFSEVYNNI